STPHSDRDFTLSVTSLTSEDDGTHSIITTSNLAVKVSGIADTTEFQIVKASGFEDRGLALQIPNSTGDTDGSETLVVYIRGAPTGVSLSAGRLLNNIWTLQQAQLSGLKLTSKAHSDRDFTLSVTSLSSEDDGTHSITVTSNLVVKISGIADTAKLQSQTHQAIESNSANLIISTSLVDTDGSETLQVQISTTTTHPATIAVFGNTELLAHPDLSAGNLSGWFSSGAIQQGAVSSFGGTGTDYVIEMINTGASQQFSNSLTGLTVGQTYIFSIDVANQINGAGQVLSRSKEIRIYDPTSTGTVAQRVTDADISSNPNDPTTLNVVFTATSTSHNLIVEAVDLAGTSSPNNPMIGPLLTRTSVRTYDRLSASQFGSERRWTVGRSQLSNLMVEPVRGSSQDFNLQITTLASELDGTHSSFVTTTAAVNVHNVLIPPVDQGVPTSLQVGRTDRPFSLDNYVLNSAFHGGASDNWAAAVINPAATHHMTNLQIATETFFGVPGGSATGFVLDMANSNYLTLSTTVSQGMQIGTPYVISITVARQLASPQFRDDIVILANGSLVVSSFSESTLPASGAFETRSFTYTPTKDIDRFAIYAVDPVTATSKDAQGNFIWDSWNDAFGPLLKDFSVRPANSEYTFTATEAHETNVLLISNVPASVTTSMGRLASGVWTVPATQFNNLLFTPTAGFTADFNMQITPVAMDVNTGRSVAGVVKTVGIDFVGSLENMVVDYDSASIHDDEFVLAINHQDIDEDAIILYRVDKIEDGKTITDLYGNQYSGSSSGLISEDEARQLKIELNQRGTSHDVRLTQIVVRTSILDQNLQISKGVRGGTRTLERQDFAFDVDVAWQAYTQGKIADLQNVYRLKVDKRYYHLDLGHSPITSADELASRMKTAISSDSILNTLFNVGGLGDQVILQSKHVGGFRHLVEVDGILNAPDIQVQDSLTQVKTDVNNYRLTLSGHKVLSSDGFASLRINDRTFVVEAKAGTTMEQARDALVAEMNTRGLQATSVGTHQIALALSNKETIKGAFHFIESNDKLVTHYQYDAIVDQSEQSFKIKGSNLMGGTGSDHLTGSSAGEFLAGGKDEGSATVSWKNIAGVNHNVVIGVYQTDPNDPNRKIGQIIYGTGDDLSRDKVFVPFGSGGKTVVDDQYFVIENPSGTTLSSGDGVHLRPNINGKWDVYQAGYKLTNLRSVHLLDAQTTKTGQPKIITSAGIIEIDLNGNGKTDLRYQSSITISDKGDTLTGGGGSDVFFFRKGDGV
ncbi:MAG: hypothetical protein AAF403_03420, partial [Pseudomonadota bacterium]